MPPQLPTGTRIIEVSPDWLDDAPMRPPPAAGQPVQETEIDVPPDDLDLDSRDPASDPIFAGAGYIPPSARTPLVAQRQADRLSIPPPPVEPPSRHPYARLTRNLTSVTRYLAPTAGSIVGASKGAAFGTAVGGPVGGVVGGVAGGVAGGMAGEAGQMGLETVIDEAPPTREQAVERLRNEAIASVGGEALGLAGRGILKGGARLIRGTPVPEAAEIVARTRGEVLPAQVNQGRMQEWLDNILAGSMFGTGQRAAVLSRQQKELGREFTELIEQFGPRGQNPEVIGKAAQAAQAAGLKRHTAEATKQWDAVRQGAEQANVEVDLSDAIAFAQQELAGRLPVRTGVNVGGSALDDIAALGGSAVKDEVEVGGRMLSRSDPANAKIFAQLDAAGIGAPTTTFPFAQVDKLRSDIQQAIRTATYVDKNDKLAGALKQVSQRLETAIEAGLAEKSPELVKQWRAARQFTKEGKQTFETKFMRNLAKADPFTVSEMVFSTGKSSTPGTIRNFRRAVDQAGWRNVQAAAMENLVTGTGGREFVTGNELVQRLSAYKPARLAAMFPNEYRELWPLARQLQQLEKKTGPTGKMWVQFAQAGALAGVAGGATAALTGNPATGLGAGAAVLVTPSVLAKLMFSPAGRALLIRGEVTPSALRLLSGGGQAVTHAGRIVGEALVPPGADEPPRRPQ